MLLTYILPKKTTKYAKPSHLCWVVFLLQMFLLPLFNLMEEFVLDMKYKEGTTSKIAIAW